MKHLIFSFFVLLATQGAAQQFMTRSGEVHFFSETPVEDIEAENAQMACSTLQMEGLHFRFRCVHFTLTRP